MRLRSRLALAGPLLALLTLLCSGLSSLAATRADDPDAGRQRLVELLRTRQFQALDAAIADLQRGFDAKATSEWQLDLAYRAFQPYEWDVEAVLNEWVLHSPAGFQPYLARGLYFAGRGWLERGDGWDDDDAVGEQLSAMRIAYDSAIRDLQHALRLNPRLAPAWAALIAIAGGLNDLGELQHNLRAGLAAVPESMGIRWAYAYALYYREAQRELEAFVAEMQRSAPKDHPGYRGIATWLDNFEGYRLLREREYHTAILVFDRALQHDDRTRLRAGRAAAYLEIGELDAAEADLRAALAQRPWEDEYLVRLAGLLWERNKRDEVEVLLDRAISMSPMYPTHRLLRAYIRFELDRLDEALADLAVAEVYGRYDARIHHLRGDILTDRNPPAALRTLETARRLAPDSSAIQLSYAAALHRASDCRAADALVAYERMCVEARDCSPRAAALWALIEKTPCEAKR